MRPFYGEKRRREDRWDKVDARFQWKSMGSRSGGGGDKCSLTLSMQCSGAGIEDDEIGVGMLDFGREDGIKRMPN